MAAYQLFLSTPTHGLSFYLLHDNYSGFETGGKLFANDGYNFARKWLQSHPKFITNSLYIAGDSYAGKFVPIIVQAISDGIKEDYVPASNLKQLLQGYLVGNPATGSKYDDNSKIPFYNRIALISDELIKTLCFDTSDNINYNYLSAKRNCKEEYVEVDMSNVKCAKDLEVITKCIAYVNKPHILEPRCPSDFNPSDIWSIKGNISRNT
ncbi:serine carboxypeptidase-like 18 isoform X2 [Gossypium australe]|uniref:Serine carboxypeptidase-like 18 isoform X2 n=1 Tax=Gossypium australe TaxID=47621 RepID=A0A5B6UXV8_9ROSI|nr:serine carboxypeptidase-like 18 isoform X2 [Gossypium australe]